MRKEDKDSRLSEALHNLDAADVAPGWEPAAAWERIEHNLGQKRTIPLRGYAAAAAVAVLIGLTFLIRSGNKNEQGREVVKQPEIKAAPAISVQQDTIIGPALATQPRIAGKTLSQSTIPHKQHTPVIVFTVPDTSSPIAKTPDPIPPKAASSKPKPAVVYTLTEITDGEPERAAPPPRKYSGIFHSKSSSADAPAEGLLQQRRLRQDGEPGEMPSSPDIIN